MQKSTDTESFNEWRINMRKNLILVSGMPTAGKTSFSTWLSSELSIPLVSFNDIVARVSAIWKGQR